MADENVPLSEREREILKLVATGASNQQIATDLGISVNTVKVHLRNIFGKIGAASRTEATLYAMRAGLVEVGRAAPLAEAAAATAAATVAAAPKPPPAPTPAPTPAPAPRGRGRIVTAVGSVAGLLIALGLIWLLVLRNPQAAPASTPVPPQATPSQAAATASWQARRDMPIAVGGAAAASVDGRIYVIGGTTAGGVSAHTLRFDPDSNAWAALPDMPAPVRSVQAAVLGGQIFVPGGERADGSVSDALLVYDPAAQTWREKAKLPQPRSAYGLAAVDGRLYLFGGWDGAKPHAETFVYDAAADRWSEAEPMPTARAYCVAVAVDGKVYVLGGEAGGGPLTANEQYTPAIGGKGTWVKVTPLDRPRTRFGASGLTSNIIVVGGTADEPPSRYDVRTGTWEGFKAPALPLGAQPAVTTRDSSIFIAAGAPDKAASALYELRLLYTVTIQIP